MNSTIGSTILTPTALNGGKGGCTACVDVADGKPCESLINSYLRTAQFIIGTPSPNLDQDNGLSLVNKILKRQKGWSCHMKLFSDRLKNRR